MALTDVNLFRIDGDLGSVSNIQTSALNGGPLAGTRNRIINGDMRIDQRNAGASFSPSTTGAIEYSVDRFGGARPGSGVAFTLQQVADAPVGFVNSLKATVPTGATPSGTQLSFVSQPVEGLNISDLGWGSVNAQTITLSFWVKSSITGLFPLVFVNSGSVRAYGATYTINAANTWEKKTVIVPGDTSGTWLITNGLGIQVNWGLGGTGASRTVTTGWQNTPSPGSSVGVIAGTVNLVETTGATWQITGVQLEPGTVATPFERRSYGQELSLCQRYFQTIQPTVYTYTAGSATVYLPVTWSTMRDTPVAATVSQTLYGSTISVILTPEGPSGGRLNQANPAAGYGGASGNYSLSKEL